jgi:anaerobic magnesium-protoporphyrin IX monomethyl ester cyclase
VPQEGRNVAFLFINVNYDVGSESSESIPISEGYLLAGLKAGGWDGIILDDVKDRPMSLKCLEMWIQRIGPKVIGFTAYQSNMGRIRFLSRYIKWRHREICVVLGGPQMVLMPSPALEELDDVDALVRGEGESVMQEMARVLDSGDGLEHVHGITCRYKGGIFDTAPSPEPPEDLDVHPSPYLSGVLNLEGKNTAILLSSRGCCHVCWFCITPRMSRGKIRYHSVERVMAEMELLVRQGIERFWFADPTFTEDRDRTEQLLDEKIRRGITTPFWCQTRSDLVDRSLLQKLKDAGADAIAFGLESGSPVVLAKTNKRIELERLRENIKTAQSLGLETELFSMFGMPGETVDDAVQTLEFVRSSGIPIQSNSGSQQMQLYYGSTIEKNPVRFGIKALPVYRPYYLSVGDQYETDRMSTAQIRKVRNLWALANERMERDVYYKRRTFEILDFLLENRDDLAEDPAFYVYGALACAVIEEFPLLEQFLEGYEALGVLHGLSSTELVSALSFFSETLDPAGPTDRIIFDSRSYIGGVPFTGISGKYWDVLLGCGLLLPSFEEGLIGAVEGQEVKFSFVFPQDYDQSELQGKEVEVHARIHKVFRSLRVDTVQDVKNAGIRNHYVFPDLDLLREQNEILYYLALRDADPHDLLKKPAHFLMLVHKLAKLGKRDQVRQLAAMLFGKTPALNALAETLANSGKCSWALEYYELLAGQLPSAILKKVRCLLTAGEPGKAMLVMDQIPEASNLEYQETLLECLKVARPDSPRIPYLDRNVLELRVKAASEKETTPKSLQQSCHPIVHGYGVGKPLE